MFFRKNEPGFSQNKADFCLKSDMIFLVLVRIFSKLSGFFLPDQDIFSPILRQSFSRIKIKFFLILMIFPSGMSQKQNRATKISPHD